MKDIISTHKIICKNKKIKKCHKRYIGKLALMCPNCYGICMLNMDRKLKYTVKDDCKISTFTKIFGDCKHCHKFADYIEIDGNIAKTIKILNRKGYFTKYCCEGHDKVKRKNDKVSLAYIYFKNDLTYLEFIEKVLPNSWYIDQNDINKNKLIIRAKKGIPLKKRINDIQKMAKKLDDLKYTVWIK